MDESILGLACGHFFSGLGKLEMAVSQHEYACCCGGRGRRSLATSHSTRTLQGGAGWSQVWRSNASIEGPWIIGRDLRHIEDEASKGLDAQTESKQAGTRSGTSGFCTLQAEEELEPA